MPLGYEIFGGNRRDVTTVEEMVETMEKRYGKADRIWVMDRGMISDAKIGPKRKRPFMSVLKSESKRACQRSKQAV